jgi:hypothetical protein
MFPFVFVNKERASRQTHAQGNNKNNEGKHAEGDHMKKKRAEKSSEAESFKHTKIKYSTRLKMAI